MKGLPRRRTLALLVGLGLVLGVGGGATYAAFSSSTTNSGNGINAAPDFVPPQASASVIAKTTSNGYLAGFIRQGGTYYVYANVSDFGNPPSGVATVRADVSTITTGAVSVALVSGSYSVNGVTYNYRSASTTANNPLAAGPKSYTLTMTDVAGNGQTQAGFSVTVDNAAPAGADIQTANGGATPGKAETGDQVIFTYSETMDPGTIIAGWTGGALTVTVRLINGPGASTDTVEVWDAANATALNLGTVRLNRNDYVAASVNFTNSTIAQAGSVITVTLGNPSGATLTAAGTGNMTWRPVNTATDAAGNACSTAWVSEAGAADAEF